METKWERLKQGEQLYTKQCGSDHKHDRNSDKGRTERTALLRQWNIRQIVGSYILAVWDK